MEEQVEQGAGGIDFVLAVLFGLGAILFMYCIGAMALYYIFGVNVFWNILYSLLFVVICVRYIVKSWLFNGVADVKRGACIIGILIAVCMLPVLSQMSIGSFVTVLHIEYLLAKGYAVYLLGVITLVATFMLSNNICSNKHMVYIEAVCLICGVCIVLMLLPYVGISLWIWGLMSIAIITLALTLVASWCI